MDNNKLLKRTLSCEQDKFQNIVNRDKVNWNKKPYIMQLSRTHSRTLSAPPEPNPPRRLSKSAQELDKINSEKIPNVKSSPDYLLKVNLPGKGRSTNKKLRKVETGNTNSRGRPVPKAQKSKQKIVSHKLQPNSARDTIHRSHSQTLHTKHKKTKKEHIIIDFTLPEELTEEILGTLLNLLKSKENCIDFIKKNGLNSLLSHLNTDDAAIVCKILQILKLRLITYKDTYNILFLESLKKTIQYLCDVLVKFRDSANVKIHLFSFLARLPYHAYYVTDEEVHKHIMTIFYDYNYKTNETRRFEHLVHNLDRWDVSPKLKIPVMKLIITLVKIPINLDERMGIRTQFLSLGLTSILQNLSHEKDATLDALVNEFNIDMEKDESEWRNQLSKIDEFSPTWNDQTVALMVATLIKRVSKHQAHFSLFLSILRNMLKIEQDPILGLTKWRLIENNIMSIIHSDTNSNSRTMNIEFEEKKLLREFQERKEQYEQQLSYLENKYREKKQMMESSQEIFNNFDKENVDDINNNKKQSDLKEFQQKIDQLEKKEQSFLQLQQKKERELQNIQKMCEELKSDYQELNLKYNQLKSQNSLSGSCDLPSLSSEIEQTTSKIPNTNVNSQTAKTQSTIKNPTQIRKISIPIKLSNISSKTTPRDMSSPREISSPKSLMQTPKTPKTPTITTDPMSERSLAIPKWKTIQLEREQSAQKKALLEKSVKLIKTKFIQDRVKNSGRDAPQEKINEHSIIGDSIIEDDGIQTESSKIKSIVKWIKTLLPHVDVKNDGHYFMYDLLKDGTILCQIIDKLKPKCINFHQKFDNDQFCVEKARSNIEAFISACKTEFYMEELLIFDLNDFDKENMSMVIDCLYNLKRIVESSRIV